MLADEWLHPQVGLTLDCRSEELDYGYTVCSDQPIQPNELVLRSQVIGRGKAQERYYSLMEDMCPRTDPPDYEAKYKKNAFFQGTILLNIGSFFNHNCAPNCNYYLDSVTDEVMFLSVRQLEPNEELTISYYHFPIDSYQVRQTLNQLYGFHCRCETCATRAAPSKSLIGFAKLPLTVHCWWCGSLGKLRCTNCDQACFCSEQCRKKDQLIHRTICNRLKVLK